MMPVCRPRDAEASRSGVGSCPQMGVIAGVQRHHQVIARCDLVEACRDVLRRDHGHLSIASWDAGLRSNQRRHSRIASVTMANPNPKSSTGMSHGARSPSISSGL